MAADGSLYEIGDFVIVLNQDALLVRAGYVSTTTATQIRLASTTTDAWAGEANTYNRTNGDTYTILKVEYSTSETADLTWTDIIGDPANYPRQATGVIDFLSDAGTVAIAAGQTVEHVGNNPTGTAGNIYLSSTNKSSNNPATTNFGNSSAWQDLGTKAEFLSNAQGF